MLKELYDNLVVQSSDFPSDDLSPNLQECIRSVNFVRAEMLARRHNLPSSVFRSLQELALMQYARDFRNLTGFEKLVKEYNITPSERKQIVLNIFREETYPCFSFSKHTERSINESWAEWTAGYVWQRGAMSRFTAWLKSIFRIGGRE